MMAQASCNGPGSIAALLCALCALSVRADAPPGRYTVNGSTVLDNITLLTWQSAAAGPYTRPDAASHCAGLGSGWRVPSMTELQSLVDDTRHDPAIDPTAFPNTPSDWFWAADAYTDKPGNYWKVDFGTAYTIDDQPGALCRIRCVR
jgi:Protein of unknown function (DUF1566)